MKKLMTFLLVIVMLLSTFTGCSKNTATKTENEKKENKLSIVCTIFPEYDWVKQILGSHTDEVELTMLLDNGVDLHSYQPTADDIINISTCDMFIYVGGESDGWVEDALKEATNKDMVVVDLLEVLKDTVKEEEVKEGMESEEEGESGEESDKNSGEEEEEPEYDEHVWLSLKNAEKLCTYISERLCEIDEKNSKDYDANTSSYVAELSTLDASFNRLLMHQNKKPYCLATAFHLDIWQMIMLWITMRLLLDALLKLKQALKQWHFLLEK